MPLPPTPEATAPSSAKLYHHITELPLCNFIDCSVNGNYHALVISGHPTEKELLFAWSNIQQEYADVMGDHEHRLYISLFKEVTLLNVTLQTIHYLIEILQELYYEPYAAQLNKLLKTDFKFDHNDQMRYQELLRRCFNRSKGLKIDFELKLAQFKAIEKKNQDNGKKPTREYFQSILITLSDHSKYQLQDSITVYEFCDRIRRFTKYCEQVEKMKK